MKKPLTLKGFAIRAIIAVFAMVVFSVALAFASTYVQRGWTAVNQQNAITTLNGNSLDVANYEATTYSQRTTLLGFTIIQLVIYVLGGAYIGNKFYDYSHPS